SWENYAPHSHVRFTQTILQSYQESLDCPGLNGLRDINDIIAGHRATGEFEPSNWFLLHYAHEPIGVLLLSRAQRTEVVELVYLGLVRAHRGRGAGDILMRRAAAVTARSRHGRLSLAVDAGNLPALKLYWRHGLQVVGRKLAMLRDLRQ